jgi:hypothetical protein
VATRPRAQGTVDEEMNTERVVECSVPRCLGKSLGQILNGPDIPAPGVVSPSRTMVEAFASGSGVSSRRSPQRVDLYKVAFLVQASSNFCFEERLSMKFKSHRLPRENLEQGRTKGPRRVPSPEFLTNFQP